MFIPLPWLVILAVFILILLIALAYFYNAKAWQGRYYQSQIDQLQRSSQDHAQQAHDLQQDINRLTRDLAMREQEITQLKAQLSENDKTKDIFLNYAKQSVQEMAQSVSSKLLADHKQENIALQRQSTDALQNITKTTLERLDQVSHKVAEVGEVSRQNNTNLNILERALTAPGGAGQASETSLSNALKAMGLSEGTDYILQHTFQSEGKQLRPDAIVFLPNDHLLVIDSKSSKFIYEYASLFDDSDSEEQREKVLKQFSDSMNQHLKSLKQTDYANEIANAIKNYDFKGKTPRINQLFEGQRTIMTLMWLPHQGAINLLQKADSSFMDKASRDKIFPVSSNALYSAIAVAQNAKRQSEHDANLAKIADEVASLIGKLRPMVEHADKMGKSLTSTVKSYDSFARSLNSNVLGSANKLVRLGVSAPAKGLPAQLKGLKTDEQVIEATSNTPDDTPSLINHDQNDEAL